MYISAIVQCSGPVKSCLVRSVVQCLVELQYLEVMRVQLWLLNLLRSLACFFFPLLAECCQRLLPLAALMFPQGVYVTLHKYFSICLAGRIRSERGVSANISTAFLLNALLKLLVSFIVHTAKKHLDHFKTFLYPVIRLPLFCSAYSKCMWHHPTGKPVHSMELSHRCGPQP